MKPTLNLSGRHINNYTWHKPCGPSVISILTGLSIEEVIRRMLAYRRSRPRYTSEYTYYSDRKYRADENTMYLREMMHFLRPFTSCRRPIHTNTKTITIEDLIQASTRVPMVVATNHHFVLLENGRISDNQWYRRPIASVYYRKAFVHYVIPLVYGPSKKVADRKIKAMVAA